jgi:ubiquinol-cytochrome c reductase iron-sulfur subunit
VTPPPDAPSGTSADAAGSIRDRLRSPVASPGANEGGDSRGSEVREGHFQQSDSAALLADHGRSDRQESHSAGAEAIDDEVAGQRRKTDLDPAAAARAERAVAALFLLSVAGVLGFVIWYFVAEMRFGHTGNTIYTPILGLFMTIALGGIGAGAVLWAKNLMVDEDAVQERHPFGSDPEQRAATAQALRHSARSAGLARRPLLLGSLALGAGSLALLPIPFVLGMGRFQFKEKALAETAWRKGMRLYRTNGTPVRLGDLEIGGVESVFPDVENGSHRADSPALLVRMRPEELHPPKGRQGWDYQGHLVYSSICTHLGCPVKLYEQQTHHLFCPCHQSTFDASRGAEVLFGPAARPLPQLAISVDNDGYFVAQGDFSEPIGPSYWERKS